MAPSSSALVTVCDALLHEIGAVVERHQLDALRQRLLDRGQLLLHGVDDIAPACALEHQDDAGDDFAFAVHGDRALAQLGADPHLGDVPHVDGRVLVRATTMLSMSSVDLTSPSPRTTYCSAPVLDEVAAGVGVVLLERLEHLLEREIVGGQAIGIDDHLVLLHQRRRSSSRR